MEHLEKIDNNFKLITGYVLNLESKIKQLESDQRDLAFKIEAMTMLYPDKEGITLSDLEYKLGISRSTAKRWVKLGKIIRIGKARYALNKDSELAIIERLRGNIPKPEKIAQKPLNRVNFSDII